MQREAWMYVVAVAVVALIAAGTLLSVNDGTPSRTPEPSGHGQPDGEGTVAAPNLAEERDAQAMLRNVLVAAKIHYADEGTYEGFTPRTAAKIEPSYDYARDEPASLGTVTINLATGDDVVLSTAIGGEVFCISEHDEPPGAGTFYGRVDGYRATSAADCAGGW